MKIVFTGGGTGGHIFPILAILEELQKRDMPQLEYFYVGPDSLLKEDLNGINLRVRKISAGKFRRYASIKNVLDVGKIFLGIIQSYWHLFRIMPDVIFGKGGYGSFPVVIVGWLFRIPIIIHESDAIPGLTNRVLGRFAKTVAYSFKFEEDYFPYHKLVYTGNPVRKMLTGKTAQEAKKHFQLAGNKKVILVMGGSQGSLVLNGVILDVLGTLLKEYEIIHISGPTHFEGVARESRIATKRQGLSSYHLYPFLNQKELAFAYSAADLVISRAGAGSIFEIAEAGKPSIIVPLANSASAHQQKNALVYHKTGACRMIEEESLTPHVFLGTVQELLGDNAALSAMSVHAKKFATPDAASLIADENGKNGKYMSSRATAGKNNLHSLLVFFRNS